MSDDESEYEYVTVTVAEGPWWLGLCGCRDDNEDFIVPEGIEFAKDKGQRPVEKILSRSSAENNNAVKKKPLPNPPNLFQSNHKQTVNGDNHDGTAANSKTNIELVRTDERRSDSDEKDERTDEEDSHTPSPLIEDQRDPVDDTDAFDSNDISKPNTELPKIDGKTHQMSSDDRKKDEQLSMKIEGLHDDNSDNSKNSEAHTENEDSSSHAEEEKSKADTAEDSLLSIGSSLSGANRASSRDSRSVDTSSFSFQSSTDDGKSTDDPNLQSSFLLSYNESLNNNDVAGIGMTIPRIISSGHLPQVAGTAEEGFEITYNIGIAEVLDINYLKSAPDDTEDITDSSDKSHDSLEDAHIIADAQGEHQIAESTIPSDKYQQDAHIIADAQAEHQTAESTIPSDKYQHLDDFEKSNHDLKNKPIVECVTPILPERTGHQDIINSEGSSNESVDKIKVQDSTSVDSIEEHQNSSSMDTPDKLHNMNNINNRGLETESLESADEDASDSTAYISDDEFQDNENEMQPTSTRGTNVVKPDQSVSSMILPNIISHNRNNIDSRALETDTIESVDEDASQVSDASDSTTDTSDDEFHDEETNMQIVFAEGTNTVQPTHLSDGPCHSENISNESLKSKQSGGVDEVQDPTLVTSNQYHDNFGNLDNLDKELMVERVKEECTTTESTISCDRSQDDLEREELSHVLHGSEEKGQMLQSTSRSASDDFIGDDEIRSGSGKNRHNQRSMKLLDGSRTEEMAVYTTVHQVSPSAEKEEEILQPTSRPTPDIFLNDNISGGGETQNSQRFPNGSSSEETAAVDQVQVNSEQREQRVTHDDKLVSESDVGVNSLPLSPTNKSDDHQAFDEKSNKESNFCIITGPGDSYFPSLSEDEFDQATIRKSNKSEKRRQKKSLPSLQIVSEIDDNCKTGSRNIPQYEHAVDDCNSKHIAQRIESYFSSSSEDENEHAIIPPPPPPPPPSRSIARVDLQSIRTLLQTGNGYISPASTNDSRDSEVTQDQTFQHMFCPDKLKESLLPLASKYRGHEGRLIVGKIKDVENDHTKGEKSTLIENGKEQTNFEENEGAVNTQTDTILEVKCDNTDSGYISSDESVVDETVVDASENETTVHILDTEGKECPKKGDKSNTEKVNAILREEVDNTTYTCMQGDRKVSLEDIMSNHSSESETTSEKKSILQSVAQSHGNAVGKREICKDLQSSADDCLSALKAHSNLSLSLLQLPNCESLTNLPDVINETHSSSLHGSDARSKFQSQSSLELGILEKDSSNECSSPHDEDYTSSSQSKRKIDFLQNTDENSNIATEMHSFFSNDDSAKIALQMRTFSSNSKPEENYDTPIGSNVTDNLLIMQKCSKDTNVQNLRLNKLRSIDLSSNAARKASISLDENNGLSRAKSSINSEEAISESQYNTSFNPASIVVDTLIQGDPTNIHNSHQSESAPFTKKDDINTNSHVNNALTNPQVKDHSGMLHSQYLSLKYSQTQTLQSNSNSNKYISSSTTEETKDLLNTINSQALHSSKGIRWNDEKLTGSDVSSTMRMNSHAHTHINGNSIPAANSYISPDSSTEEDNVMQRNTDRDSSATIPTAFPFPPISTLATNLIGYISPDSTEDDYDDSAAILPEVLDNCPKDVHFTEVDMNLKDIKEANSLLNDALSADTHIAELDAAAMEILKIPQLPPNNDNILSGRRESAELNVAEVTCDDFTVENVVALGSSAPFNNINTQEYCNKQEYILPASTPKMEDISPNRDYKFHDQMSTRDYADTKSISLASVVEEKNNIPTSDLETLKSDYLQVKEAECLRQEEEAKIQTEKKKAARKRSMKEARLAAQEKAMTMAAAMEAQCLKIEKQARAKAEKEEALHIQLVKEEAEHLQLEEAAKIQAEKEETARQKVVKDTKLAAEEEAKAKAAEEAYCLKMEEEARVKAEKEEAARIQLVKEEAEHLQQEEAAKILAEREETARQQVVKDAKLLVEEEARVKAASEEAYCLKMEEEARVKAEEEEVARIQLLKEETERLQHEEVVKILAEKEETARQQVVKDAKLLVEEEAKVKAAAEEAYCLKMEKEGRAKAEEEEVARIQSVIEEAERSRVEEEEAKTQAEEIQAVRLQTEEKARLAAEEKAMIKATVDQAYCLKMEEEARVKAEQEEAAAEEVRVKVKEQEAVTKAAAEEAKVKAEVEEAARIQLVKDEAERLQLEEDAKIKAEEKAKAMIGAEEEALAKALAEEASCFKIEEEARVKAEEEEAAHIQLLKQLVKKEVERLQLEEEAEIQAEEEEKARLAAEEEALVKAAADEEARLAAEEEALAKAAAEEEAKCLKVKEETRVKAEEEESARIQSVKQLVKEEAERLWVEEEATIQAKKKEATYQRTEKDARQAVKEETLAKTAAEEEAEHLRVRKEARAKAAAQVAERLKMEKMARVKANEAMARANEAMVKAKEARVQAEEQRAALSGSRKQKVFKTCALEENSYTSQGSDSADLSSDDDVLRGDVPGLDTSTVDNIWNQVKKAIDLVAPSPEQKQRQNILRKMTNEISPTLVVEERKLSTSEDDNWMTEKVPLNSSFEDTDMMNIGKGTQPSNHMTKYRYDDVEGSDDIDTECKVIQKSKHTVIEKKLSKRTLKSKNNSNIQETAHNFERDYGKTRDLMDWSGVMSELDTFVEESSTSGDDTSTISHSNACGQNLTVGGDKGLYVSNFEVSSLGMENLSPAPSNVFIDTQPTNRIVTKRVDVVKIVSQTPNPSTINAGSQLNINKIFRGTENKIISDGMRDGLNIHKNIPIEDPTLSTDTFLISEVKFTPHERSLHNRAEYDRISKQRRYLSDGTRGLHIQDKTETNKTTNEYTDMLNSVDRVNSTLRHDNAFQEPSTDVFKHEILDCKAINGNNKIGLSHKQPYPSSTSALNRKNTALDPLNELKEYSKTTMGWGESITKQAARIKGRSRNRRRNSLHITPTTEDGFSPQHKLDWKSVGTPGVLEKRRKREAMLEKFQQQLVKVRAFKKPIEESTILNNGVIDIENSDDVSSIHTSSDDSCDSHDEVSQVEEAKKDGYNSALQDWRVLQDKMASDTEKLKTGER